MTSYRFPTGWILALLLGACGAAVAQTAWPERPITMIVPFPPGGVADTVARPVAEALGRELKQPVVVENKAGAGGALGIGVASRAPADGYTVLLSLSSISILPEADKHPRPQARVPARAVQADRALHRRPDGAGRARRRALEDASQDFVADAKKQPGRLQLRQLGQLRDDARADGDAEVRRPAFA